jgi:hypothetical protein
LAERRSESTPSDNKLAAKKVRLTRDETAMSMEMLVNGKTLEARTAAPAP